MRWRLCVEEVMLGTVVNERKLFTVLNIVNEWCDDKTLDSQ